MVNALGQTLKRADETLRQAVRNVALEPELRRDSLKELQALAGRMGALPRAPAASPESAPLNSEL